MPTKVTIINNGPIRLEGDFEVFDATGNQYGLAGRTAVFLCRCGQSKDKPFCDGTHSGVFDSQCQARDLTAPE